LQRDPSLERHLVGLAAQAAGHVTIDPQLGIPVGDDGGLTAYSERRILPGPVRDLADWDTELREELADARNYAVWGIQRDWPAYQAGEPVAAEAVARRLRALAHVVEAWHALSR
jgi:hypothetical protein